MAILAIIKVVEPAKVVSPRMTRNQEALMGMLCRVFVARKITGQKSAFKGA